MKQNHVRILNRQNLKYARWGDFACALYILLMWSIHLFGLPRAGYAEIAVWKFRSFLGISVIFFGLLFCRMVDRCLDGHLTYKPRKNVSLLIYLLFTLLSAICSQYSGAFIGNTRQEGFLTIAFYICTAFLLQQTFMPKGWMIAYIGGAISLFCLFGIPQFLGKNPGSLYPNGYNYFDADHAYLGKYWSTVGNTGLCAALLVMAAGFFTVYMIRGKKMRYFAIIPLFLSIFSITELRSDAGILALAVGLPCLLPLCIRSSDELSHALEAACVAILAYGVAAGVIFSREAFRFIFEATLLPVALACLCVIGSVILKKHPLKLPESSLRRYLLLAILLCFVMALFALYFTSSLSAGPLWELRQLLHGNWSDDFGSGRLYIWRNVWNLVKEKPILGGGPDTLGLREIAWSPTYYETLQTTVTTQIDAAHNEFLQVLVNQGVLALAAYLAILVQAFTVWLRRRDDLCCAMCGAAILLYLLQSVFGLSSPITAPYFWMALGCLMSTSNREGSN